MLTAKVQRVRMPPNPVVHGDTLLPRTPRFMETRNHPCPLLDHRKNKTPKKRKSAYGDWVKKSPSVIGFKKQKITIGDRIKKNKKAETRLDKKITVGEIGFKKQKDRKAPKGRKSAKKAEKRQKGRKNAEKAEKRQKAEKRKKVEEAPMRLRSWAPFPPDVRSVPRVLGET
jgi:hypothetical protein